VSSDIAECRPYGIPDGIRLSCRWLGNADRPIDSEATECDEQGGNLPAEWRIPMKLATGWPHDDPILDDLDDRPPDDPDWTQPARLSRRSDDRVWCCVSVGWVSDADAFDHAWDTPRLRDDDLVGLPLPPIALPRLH